MSLPATCVKDPFLYDRLLHGGLVVPITVGEAAVMPADMPHGAFGKLVRDTVDPLWGGYDLAPAEWSDLSDLLAEVKPDNVAELSLWVFDPCCRLNRVARKIYGRDPEMAALLLDLKCRIDPYGDDFGLYEDEGEEAGEPLATPSTVELTASIPAVAAPESPPSNVIPIRQPEVAAPPPPEPVKPKDTRMNITVEKAPLLAALKRAAASVAKKATMPIMECVLLDVSGIEMTISATDGAVEVQVKISAGIGATPGRLAVVGSSLVAAIDALPDGSQATLERTEDGRLRILSGRTRFHLPIHQPDAFPAFAAPDGVELRVQVAELKRAIDRVSFAICTDDIAKPSLCGMFLHIRPEGLRVVGSNTNVLSRADLPTVTPVTDLVAAFEAVKSDMPGVLIPRESVTALRRLLDVASDEAAVVATIGRKRVVFDLFPVRFATNLAAAQYATYENLINHGLRTTNHRLAVPRPDFLSCIKRVRAVAGDKNRAVALTVTADGVRVATTGQSGSDATDIMEAPTGYGGGSLVIGFASGMLMSALEALGGARLLCSLGAGIHPVFWRAEQEEDALQAEHLIVVMPYRLDGPAPVAAGGAQ